MYTYIYTYIYMYSIACVQYADIGKRLEYVYICINEYWQV